MVSMFLSMMKRGAASWIFLDNCLAHMVGLGLFLGSLGKVVCSHIAKPRFPRSLEQRWNYCRCSNLFTNRQGKNGGKRWVFRSRPSTTASECWAVEGYFPPSSQVRPCKPLRVKLCPCWTWQKMTCLALDDAMALSQIHDNLEGQNVL